MRTAGSPTQQLRLLNRYRPAELAASGASEEQWDAAVYTTLDRATLIKRLLRAGSAGGEGAGFGGAGGSAASTPGSSASGSPAAQLAPFTGPVAALLPRDRLGALMLDATRRALAAGSGGSTAAAGAELAHIPLDARHTECLLSDRGRQATAVQMVDAIRALLPRL